MSAVSAAVLAVGALILVAATWTHCFGRFAPEPYRSRRCQGRAWKRAFPAASKQDVREFLGILGRSFVFREEQTLQFAPADGILTIYRTIYPRAGGVDACELEALTMAIQRAYGVRLADVWFEELTLGKLFALCAAERRRRAGDA